MKKKSLIILISSCTVVAAAAATAGVLFLPKLFKDKEQQEELKEPSFALAHDSLALSLDEEFELGYTVENIAGSVKFTSSDSNIVSTAGNRLLAKNEGQVVITAKAGTFTKTCNVSVSSNGNGQYFVDSSKAINIEKDSEGLTPEFHYYVIEDGKKYEILGEHPKFEVKDSAIARIENGKIIPVSEGQTTVKVDYPKASSEFMLNVCTKVITNVNQFRNVALSTNPGAFYALANDLDFTELNYESYSTGNDLTNYGSAFKGTFEGNGYTIKGIKLNGNSGKNHSIFGVLNNAHIKDVNFEDVVLDNKGAESMSVLANAITGDDCEIKNVKISCEFKGSTTGTLNLITSKYLEKSYTNFDSNSQPFEVSYGSTKISNVIIDAKFNGNTMAQANCNICPKDSKGFRPEFSNVLIYAPGGSSEEIPGVQVFKNKLDLIWYVHNEKCLPDANWDYSEEFKIPSLAKASSTSGLVFTQGTKADIDPNYEIIKANINGAETTVYPYGRNIEGFVYGDHPTEKSKTAVFVDQRWASYKANLTIPAADLDITQYSKVCFFVRTKTFDKSFITIKDLNTNADYSTLRYDCEVSDKWVKVEMEKVGVNNWRVYIGKDKIDHIYTANYFKEIPLRFNDTRYFYSEMLGVRDPNVVPKQWVSTGTFITKTNGDPLPTTTSTVCTTVPSVASTIVEGAGANDLAKFITQNTSVSNEFKFYARGASADNNYFILSLNGSDVIPNSDGTPTQGLVSFKASSTNWTCFKFVINNGKMDIYRDDDLLTTGLTASFDDFGVQLSSGRFYVTEMFCYK